jgi:hypothetical protein
MNRIFGDIGKIASRPLPFTMSCHFASQFGNPYGDYILLPSFKFFSMYDAAGSLRPLR